VGASMKIHLTSIQDVVCIETIPVVDHRGSFSRLFCQKELAIVLGHRQLVQINHAHSIQKGCVRGLHYQKYPHDEMKIVRCIRGRVWDVAVDLRAGSPTFLQWYAHELTENNNMMLVVPEGFAHGYQALEAGSEIIYFNTMFYAPEYEAAVHYADPSIKIKWPLPPVDVSARDQSHPYLSSDFSGLKI
jgi:dTDP-4-dehydrorhamnose 3,5-epimerase